MDKLNGFKTVEYHCQNLECPNSTLSDTGTVTFKQYPIIKNEPYLIHPERCSHCKEYMTDIELLKSNYRNTTNVGQLLRLIE